jgi:hypothetical protein
MKPSQHPDLLVQASVANGPEFLDLGNRGGCDLLGDLIGMDLEASQQLQRTCVHEQMLRRQGTAQLSNWTVLATEVLRMHR